MQTRGVIIFSFPRSGSSEFIKRLYFISKIHKFTDLPVVMMGEFFHWADTTTHGQFMLAKDWFEDKNTSPITIDVLEPRPDLDFSKSQEPKLAEFFNTSSRTFSNADEIVDYYAKQYRSRINYANTYLISNCFPIIKSFPGFQKFMGNDTDIKTLQENLVRYLPRFEPIFYYKKNLADCILSDLIKWHYIVKPAINTNSTVDGFTGHNINNTMQLLDPKPEMYIDIEKWLMPDIICNTLKIYQQNKSYFKNVISFDQVFVDDDFQLNLNNTNYQVKGINQRSMEQMDAEFPMNYSAPRKDYFENSDAMLESLKRKIDEYNLNDVVDELGLIIE